MKRITKLTLLSALLVIGLGAGSAAADGYSYSDRAPPAPRHVQVRPQAGYVFVQGHWAWEQRGWVWIPGYYERERVGYVWNDGGWDNHGEGWVWRAGHWDRADGHDRLDHFDREGDHPHYGLDDGDRRYERDDRRYERDDRRYERDDRRYERGERRRDRDHRRWGRGWGWGRGRDRGRS